MPSRPDLVALFAGTPVVPVLTIDTAASALPLARALLAGGLGVLEITLRTPAALPAIAALAGAAEGAGDGAGPVPAPAQCEAAVGAGARHGARPGATPALRDAASASPVPFLPAAATPSEAMALLERGHSFLKFFPAEPAGCIAYLKALAAPLPEIRFCPTGGIDAAKAALYLDLP